MKKFAMNNIRCHKCNVDLPPAARYCSSCGASVVLPLSSVEEGEPSDIDMTQPFLRSISKKEQASLDEIQLIPRVIKGNKKTRRDLMRSVLNPGRERNMPCPHPTIASIEEGSRSQTSEAKPLPAKKPSWSIYLLDLLCLLLPLCSFKLWWYTLSGIHLPSMNDLGLVSVLPPLNIFALFIMLVSFCLALRQARTPILLLHCGLLIFMLYGITTLIEVEPHFNIIYRHEGYTEYIMRTGGVNPYLDAYFNWPGFFIWTAFLTPIAGYHNIYNYAVWAPVFLNIVYLGPMYSIFTSFTSDKRQVWLALWLFCLTNWIGQDYYSPQGLDFFLYLVIIAILLKWFKRPPRSQHSTGQQDIIASAEWEKQHPWRITRLVGWFFDWLKAPDPLYTPPPSGQRSTLLVILFIVFSFIVISHPLTPFFVLTSVIALVVFRRITPFWLPLVMILMTGTWIAVMAQPFLSGHLDWITAPLGHLTSIFNANVTQRVEGNAQHLFITEIRIVMTIFIWGLAFLGAVWRLLHGYRDITIVLLALAPFPLFVVQPYGGEMLLRVYLFTLPPMVFFAATLFCHVEGSLSGLEIFGRRFFRKASTATLITIALCTILLGGFFFTRYGNEHMDYMTTGEVAGVQHLYNIATPNAIFVSATDGAPWQQQDFEKYDLYILTDELPDAVARRDIKTIVQFIDGKRQYRTHSNVYLLFTRSQKITANSVLGLPVNALDRLEGSLLASGRFKLIYGTSDAQILLYVPK